MLGKLFINNLKMLVRNRQALFWSLAFPLIFTVIFGFFFGKGSSTTGTVALIDKSSSQLAQSIEKSMGETDLFKVQKEDNVDQARDELKRGKIVSVVYIPEKFAVAAPDATTQITLIADPGNAQANSVITGFLDKFLTSASFEAQNAKPLFTINVEQSVGGQLTYFDFVLIGLLGMALMNSSVQGVAITMSKYRDDKILKRLTTTPLQSWKFIAAEVASRLILNLVQIGLILLIGVYGFDAHLHGNIFAIFGFAALGAILFQLIGFTVASLSKTTQAAEGMAVAITIPMMFLAGVFFPIDQLPKWLFAVVQYLPLAPLLRMMRLVALEASSPFTDWRNITIVLSWIVAALIISSLRFRLSDE